MTYCYARVLTDIQSVAAQVAALQDAGAAKAWHETGSNVQTNRAQFRKALADLDADDILFLTRIDRLARSTGDLSNTLAAITGKNCRVSYVCGRIGRDDNAARWHDDEDVWRSLSANRSMPGRPMAVSDRRRQA
jgi:DNA invertase Pin-like site-specific DNA recombinase